MNVNIHKAGWLLLSSLVGGGLCGTPSVSFAEHPYAGLWVGRAAVSYVNEVTVALDENNISVAPDPAVPTPAFDSAYVRLILHVNGDGQVNLLRDVAVLRANDASSSAGNDSESDYVLVTDDRLYTDFITEEATRIASAAFEFGDSKTTDALDDLVDTVCSTVAETVIAEGVGAGSVDSVYRTAEQNAQTAAEAAANPLVQPANVAESFNQFLATDLAADDVTALALAEPRDFNPLRALATTLADASFYADTRALALVDELELNLTGLVGNVARQVAHNTVARYADVDNLYQRFISGRDFGAMIEEVAESVAAAKENAGTDATAVILHAAADAGSQVASVRTEAIRTLMSAYEDVAATEAVDVVIAAMVDYALLSTDPVASSLRASIEEVGLMTLQNEVPRYALLTETPTADYTAFVTSSAFSDSVATAAQVAAVAAVKEAKNNQYATEKDLKDVARVAAVAALKVPYASAARARQCELPLTGAFGAGEGDARLVSAGGAPLSSAALSGTVVLPASHPVNPFRHRRHPDHSVGFNITRNVRFDFDEERGQTNTAYGVDQVTGIYREEIFGLHKALGTNPTQNPIGLKVEGTFELNRISRIDTLNAY